MQLQESTKLLHLSLYVLTPKRHLFGDIQKKNELDTLGSFIESSISGMQVKKQQLELDMEQWTGSKLGKEYIKPAHCHPAYLTYMQSIMPGLMKHKLESRWLGKISITSDKQMTPPLWHKVKKN